MPLVLFPEYGSCMTELSEAYKKACAAYVDEVSDNPRKPFEFLVGYQPPAPIVNPHDWRMNLTIRDMPKTEPQWPDGTKTNLPLKGRSTVQKDTDPDAKRPPMSPPLEEETDLDVRGGPEGHTPMRAGPGDNAPLTPGSGLNDPRSVIAYAHRPFPAALDGYADSRICPSCDSTNISPGPPQCLDCGYGA